MKNGLRNGVGKAVYANGNVYSGQWKDDENTGYGMFKFKTGCTYYGEWNNGKPNGEGVVIYYNGEILGAGIFVNSWMKQKGKINY